MFKQFLIGLKQNLREEDNLSTRDKWPVPKVSSVRRFYCIYIVQSYRSDIVPFCEYTEFKSGRRRGLMISDYKHWGTRKLWVEMFYMYSYKLDVRGCCTWMISGHECWGNGCWWVERYISDTVEPRWTDISPTPNIHDITDNSKSPNCPSIHFNS